MNTTAKINIMKLYCLLVTLGMFRVDEEFLRVQRRQIRSIIMPFLSGHGHYIWGNSRATNHTRN
jgi:hypothetical protein